MDSDTSGPDQLDNVRAEREEWRRRAEVAEAVAAERLARAETAERALAAAESVLARLSDAGAPGLGPARPRPAGPDRSGDGAVDPAPPRPRSLLERWRRYTDTIN